MKHFLSTCMVLALGCASAQMVSGGLIYSSVSNEGYSKGGFGANLNYTQALTPEFSVRVGADYTLLDKADNVSVGHFNTHLDALYGMTASSLNLYVGPSLGFAGFRADATNGPMSATASLDGYAVGGIAGVQYPISGQLHAFGEVYYNRIFMTSDIGSFNVVGTRLGVGYAF